MKKIDDLSHSNLNDLIQHDEKKGANCLDSFAHELVEVRAEIAKLEKELQEAKFREQSLLEAGKMVIKHLNKDTPLIIQRKNYVVLVGINYEAKKDFDLKIQKNVL